MPKVRPSTPLKIYEHKFSVENPLMQSIFGRVSTENYPKAYCQAVYFNKSNPKIIASKLVYLKESGGEPKSFNSLLSSGLSFDDCLIISTLYYTQKHEVIEKVLQTKATPNDFEFLLKPTNGYIIYCYQLEELAQLVLGINHDESVELRKSYNKLPSSIERFRVEGKKLNHFKEIIESRLITKTVRYPNYSGAKNLMSYAKTNYGSSKKTK